MRFWERFSRITFNLFILISGKKLREKSIESVLKNAVAMIDAESLQQMRAYVISQQTNEGGFPDRAGKCDIYYSLFGCFVAEALGIAITYAPLKKYVTSISQMDTLSGINLHCASILYAKLFGMDTFPQKLKQKVLTDLNKSGNQLPVYSNFLSILTYYYLKDVKGFYRIIKGVKTLNRSQAIPSPAATKKGIINPTVNTPSPEMPCPVTAAQLVLLSLARKPFQKTKERLMSFYRGKGGFTALDKTPAEDLLSTAVALYALNYTDSDIRLIKPDCMAYVDALFQDGGFRSTEPDVEIDMEYTFYGLLALGSLNT